MKASTGIPSLHSVSLVLKENLKAKSSIFPITLSEAAGKKRGAFQLSGKLSPALPARQTNEVAQETNTSLPSLLEAKSGCGRSAGQLQDTAKAKSKYSVGVYDKITAKITGNTRACFCHALDHD